MDFTIKDLETWDIRIREQVEKFGLDPFPQIFELCDQNQMMGYMAYSGMPSRYPHWSFGKQFERQKTLYNYGIAGLPYEMVINSNPCLAYLMQDNSLLLQILTIAHVYAHNDFFRHNFTFKQTRPEFTLEKFKNHADRIRKYNENPRIGSRKVERLLDAAHALSLNCNRYMSIKKLDQRQKEEKAEAKSGKCGKSGEKDSQKGDKCDGESPKTPADPDPDLLLFIRDNNPFLAEWEKDLLTIVHDESQYFIPQMETKIMNEGWASIWHRRILDGLELPQDLRMEFFVRHNQVIRPIPRGMNPYYLGYKIYEDIEKRWNEKEESKTDDSSVTYSAGREKIFQVRESDRDESFIRQYLTRDLMIEMDLYVHEEQGKDRVVTKVSSDDDWQNVKKEIIKSIGLNSVPVIKVHDANYNERGRLLLVHEFDGREMDEEYNMKTLRFVQRLWKGPVTLETTKKSGTIQLTCMKEDDKIDVRNVSFTG